MFDRNDEFDVFICHASEDKGFVRPLTVALRKLGVRVWFDEFEIELGDSLSKKIDKGLAASRFGLVILSPDFLEKAWTNYEFRGLISKEIIGNKVILPLWHGVTVEQVRNYSLPLADRLALKTSEIDSADIPIRILKIVRPDIYENHPRSHHEKLLTGEAMQELHAEIERIRDELYEQAERVEACPHCNAPLTGMGHEDIPDAHTIVCHKSFGCGYSETDGWMTRPCPHDPKFPKFEDFELKTKWDEDRKVWWAIAVGKTSIARKVPLTPMHGKTEDEARERLAEQYRKLK
jgi:hypothetical protein